MESRRKHLDQVCDENPNKLYNFTDKYLFRLRLVPVLNHVIIFPLQI